MFSRPILIVAGLLVPGGVYFVGLLKFNREVLETEPRRCRASSSTDSERAGRQLIRGDRQTLLIQERRVEELQTLLARRNSSKMNCIRWSRLAQSRT